MTRYLHEKNLAARKKLWGDKVGLKLPWQIRMWNNQNAFMAGATIIGLIAVTFIAWSLP